MNIGQARKWVIISSLVITGAQSLFFVVAPATGYPLEYPTNMNLLQIVSPVFLGYLGSASHFVFGNRSEDAKVIIDLVAPLIIGPIAIYVTVTIGALVAFGYLNRAGATIGSGMSTDNLATALSASLGVLAVTTGIITSYLFVSESKNQS